jgi:hypothetical protein
MRRVARRLDTSVPRSVIFCQTSRSDRRSIRLAFLPLWPCFKPALLRTELLRIDSNNYERDLRLLMLSISWISPHEIHLMSDSFFRYCSWRVVLSRTTPRLTVGWGVQEQHRKNTNPYSSIAIKNCRQIVWGAVHMMVSRINSDIFFFGYAVMVACMYYVLLFAL